MGDFNMEPESPEYCALAGAGGGYYGRVARIGTPVDAFATLEAYSPGSYSWMDPEDHGKRMHLDYCFVSCGLEGRLKSARIDTQSGGLRSLPPMGRDRRLMETPPVRRRLEFDQATFRGCSMPGCSTVSMCDTMVLRAKQ